MTALCDICQRPIWHNPTGGGALFMVQHCTCDCRDRFTWGLKQEIVRLRGLVYHAWLEGRGDGTTSDQDHEDWPRSKAKKELGEG